MAAFWAPLTAMVLFAGTAGAPALAAAEYYSWVDAKGTLHLTNVAAPAKHRPATSSDDGAYFGGDAPLVLEIQGKPKTVYRVNVTRYDALFRRAANHYNLPFAFIKAVAKVESNFDPKAVSHANARGLMQLIDSTAASLKVADPFDPEQNVFGGARYLRMLANMFDGDLILTAAAYNAGPHRVKRAKGVPKIRETQRYVKRVKTMYQHYLKRDRAR